MSRGRDQPQAPSLRSSGARRYVRKDPTPAILGGPPLFADPLFLTRPILPDEADFDALMRRVFASSWLTNNGEVLLELEKRLRLRLGVEECAAVCNGTIALQIALRSLVEEGEVVTTPFTFPATVHAILWNGLQPVFCDIDPDTYNLDARGVEAVVSERTRALLPVHVFGNPCDVEAFGKLAAQTGLRLVYDAAHAFGVFARGRPIGTWGDLSVFSFHATKLFHCAEGGAIVGADPEAFRRIGLLRNFGIVGEEEVEGLGTNGKMSELHASLALLVLDRVSDEIKARQRRYDLYAERLSRLGGVKFQARAPDAVHNSAYCAIQIDPQQFGLNRDQLHAALRAENIFARKYFWPLCSTNEPYRRLPSARPELLPNASRVAARILCLPLHGRMSEEQVNCIVDRIETIHAVAPAVARAAVH
jgi:dTDP-4-amino-4,6-dideoxygalactose transaminase